MGSEQLWPGCHCSHLAGAGCSSFTRVFNWGERGKRQGHLLEGQGGFKGRFMYEGRWKTTLGCYERMGSRASGETAGRDTRVGRRGGCEPTRPTRCSPWETRKEPG